MYEYRAKIIKVIDGDTVDVDIDLGFGIVFAKQRVRLYGIDTPESRTKDQEEKFYGNLSSDFLKEHCPKGSYITLKTHLDVKGKYGKILGEIFIPNYIDIDDTEWLNLNKIMVEKSLAVEYHGQSKSDIIKEHLYNRNQLLKLGLSY